MVVAAQQGCARQLHAVQIVQMSAAVQLVQMSAAVQLMQMSAAVQIVQMSAAVQLMQMSAAVQIVQMSAAVQIVQMSATVLSGPCALIVLRSKSSLAPCAPCEPVCCQALSACTLAIPWACQAERHLSASSIKLLPKTECLLDGHPMGACPMSASQ